MQEYKAVIPKKVLGQHFLKNKEVIAQSIGALRIRAGDTVIEIGPGTGALTGPLQATCASVGASLIVIEKDESLAAALPLKPAQIITGDALTKLPELVATLGEYKIIGNIPYYITGHLLRILSELPHKPLCTVLMVQLEVADRVCATTGSMNLLAAATQLWAKPSLLVRVPPRDFDPPPAVHSAVIFLSPEQRAISSSEQAAYYAALHRIFKQPRKLLINNLSAPAPTGTQQKQISRDEAALLISSLGLPAAARPQDLTVEQMLRISHELQ